MPITSDATSAGPPGWRRRLRLLRREDRDCRAGLCDTTPRPPDPERPLARCVSLSTARFAASARRCATCAAAERTAELMRSTWCSMDGAWTKVGTAPNTRLVLSTTGTAPGSTLSTSPAVEA